METNFSRTARIYLAARATNHAVSEVIDEIADAIFDVHTVDELFAV